MYEDFPVGGDPLDIPDEGVAEDTDIDVEAILEA